MKVRLYPFVVLLLVTLLGIFLWALVRFSPSEIFYTSYFPEIILFTFVLVGAGGFSLLRSFVRTRKKILKYDKTIRKKNERFTLIAEGINDGVWDWDLRTGKVFFSKQWRKLLSFSIKQNENILNNRTRRASLQPQKETALEEQDADWWAERIHPEDMPVVEQRMDMHFSGEKPYYEAEYRIKNGQGEYVWIHDRGHAEKDEEGNLVRMAGITSNIQDAKNVESVLKTRTSDLEVANKNIKNEKARTVALLESIGEGVIAVDCEGAITMANPASAQLLGLTVEKMIGKAFTNIIPKEEDKKEKEIYKQDRFVYQTLSTGEEYSEILYYYCADGTKFPANVTVAPIVLDGTLSGAIIVFRDITLEMEIDKQKTEFVSLASHQLRTPLSAIRWYSEMILSEKLGQLSEKQKEYVEEVYQSNIRMIDLVNSLLNVSRIEMGTFAVDPKEVDLWKLLESVVNELAPVIAEKKLHFTKDYENAPKSFCVDENLMRIIFQNLLSNSVKYTPPEGSISVTVREAGENLRVEVADTGCGIPKKDQPKMFSKLYRADNVKTKDTEGTGLGLYIIKSIVEKTGGKIWFDSVEDGGTTFFVELPITGMEKVEGAKGLET